MQLRRCTRAKRWESFSCPYSDRGALPIVCWPKSARPRQATGTAVHPRFLLTNLLFDGPCVPGLLDDATRESSASCRTTLAAKRKTGRDWPVMRVIQEQSGKNEQRLVSARATRRIYRQES